MHVCVCVCVCLRAGGRREGGRGWLIPGHFCSEADPGHDSSPVSDPGHDSSPGWWLGCGLEQAWHGFLPSVSPTSRSRNYIFRYQSPKHG